MDYLGAKQKNVVWSWCAVNEEEQKVYFSLWSDLRKKRDGVRVIYLVQEPHWGVDARSGAKSAARKDHDEKLVLVFEHSYEAFGYVVEAEDTGAEPRKIESTATSFVFQLELQRLQDGTVLGYPTSRINIG
jgi:hypothetical protein